MISAHEVFVVDATRFTSPLEGEVDDPRSGTAGEGARYP
jgi:hypothetical protein